MFSSFDIGSVFGIRARLHWSFVALIVVLVSIGWPSDDRLLTAGFLAVLFGSVFLHELGHGLVARRFGLQVLDVTLWPLGGMTRMSRIPENPRVEGWIAFAGPAVNLALAALAWPFASPGTGAAALDGTVQIGASWLQSLAVFFVVANLGLALFNLLPAFPLDGGRIARALIALRTDWVTATRRTVAIGKWIAFAMVVYGTYALVATESGSPLLPLFGVFLWFSGVRENWTVRIRHVGEEFARSMGVPVDVPVAAESPAPTSTLDAFDDPSGARRPSVLQVPERQQKERLSDSEIEALERFRGRIGRARAPD